uniref:ShKT domain-containing protein n=1 Tax=Rhabditophanes sp. KR3021 TaxID=114890 RepID=A0AC35UGS9_9BILA
MAFKSFCLVGALLLSMTSNVYTANNPLGAACAALGDCAAGLACNIYKDAAAAEKLICTSECSVALQALQCGTATCGEIKNGVVVVANLACALTDGIVPCSVTPCVDPTMTCNTFTQVCEGPPTTTTLLPSSTTTVASSVTVAATTCVDQDIGGKNDCISLGNAGYCTNLLYRNLMKTKCPFSCGYCANSAGVFTACFDGVNPYTNKTDCPAKAYLCKADGYTELMKVECRETCGYC